MNAMQLESHFKVKANEQPQTYSVTINQTIWNQTHFIFLNIEEQQFSNVQLSCVATIQEHNRVISGVWNQMKWRRKAVECVALALPPITCASDGAGVMGAEQLESSLSGRPSAIGREELSVGSRHRNSEWACSSQGKCSL